MIDCVIIRSICRATLKFLGLCNIFSSLSISLKIKMNTQVASILKKIFRLITYNM